MNVGEWMLGEAVSGIKISINCNWVRGISLAWVRWVERSGIEMDWVFPWVPEKFLKESWRAEKIVGDSMLGVNLGRKFSISEPRRSVEIGVNGGRGVV